MDSIILYNINTNWLTKYLTKIQTKIKWNRCQREYVYKDELPFYKVKFNQRQKKQVIISEMVVVIKIVVATCC